METRDQLDRTALNWLRIGCLAAGGIVLATALHGPSLALAPFCHQLPERSPVLFGIQLSLCFRCLGLLLGAMAGTLVSFSGDSLTRTRGRLLLGLGLLPMFLDVLGQGQSLYFSNPTRLLTGGLAGASAALVLFLASSTPSKGRIPC